MRWKKKIVPHPKVGDLRGVDVFLWFPKTIDGETRWLEKSTVIQELQRIEILYVTGPQPDDIIWRAGWVNLRWYASNKDGWLHVQRGF